MSSSHLQSGVGGGGAPGEASPSFAQTGGAESDLFDDDSDIDDLDLHADHGISESYEMRRPRGASRDRGGASTPLWDAQDDDADESGELRLTPEGSVSSSVASFQLYTPDEEAAVRRKFDRKLVVFVALLYMLAFLDRSNIGNAYIAGMDQDLQTTPPRSSWYEWTLAAFYISYILFEWMSLLWRIVPAHIYISMLVLSWGVIASLQAVSTSYPMLIALRALLGIGEAGFTGIPFYLSFFFKRHELAFRTAIFISAAPLATSFASTLAWVIVRCASAGPIAPWRILFLVEGFPSVVVSAIAWSVIPDSPQTASYLTKREKKVARLRLRSDDDSSQSSSSPRPTVRDTLLIFLDPVAWLSAAMFFLANMAYSSLPVFLPRILTEMGHSTLRAQALSAPPYLVSFVSVLLTARISDRRRSRAFPILLHALFSTAGYAILAFAKPLNLPPWLRYLAVYPAAVGFFNVVTLIVAWSINNQQGSHRRGAGFALLQLVGQCGPLVGTRLYPDRDGPFYQSGMTTCAAAMLAVAVLAVVLRVLLQRRNRVLESQGHKGVEDEEEGLVAEGAGVKMNGESFRYML